MPRPPPFDHPFRKVRDIVGLSQEEAAEVLGISRSALQQIERGVLPLSEEIRSRMLLATGAKLPLGLCREAMDPVAWDDSPYGRNSYEDWERIVAFTPRVRDDLDDLLVHDLSTLLHVAWRKGCFLPFVWALQTAMGEQARNFRLTGEGFLDDDTLSRLFGNLLERAAANGIDMEEAMRMAKPPPVKKSAGSKKRRS